MSWFKKHWRKVAWFLLGVGSSIAADHTIFDKKVVPVATEILDKMPCTPGEADCPSTDGK